MGEIYLNPAYSLNLALFTMVLVVIINGMI